MKAFQDLPFKFRIFLGCLIVAVIPLFFTSSLTVRILNVSLNRQNQMEGAAQLDSANERLHYFFDACGSSCRTLNADGAASWSLIESKTVDIQKDFYLSLYQAAQDTYHLPLFSVYDAGGKLRYTIDSLSGRKSFLPLQWGLLCRVPLQQQMVLSRTDPCSTSNPEVLLQAAYPLENTHGARTGYLVLDFTRSCFDQLFKGYFSANDTLLILDRYQIPFYCSNSALTDAEIAEMISSASGSSASYHYHWVRDVDYGYYMILNKTSPVSASVIQTMQTICIVLAVLCLGICLLVSVLLSRSIGRPISTLDKAMARVRDGDLSVRVRSSRRDELGRLGESFNRMTRELSENLEMQVQKQKDLNETRLKLYQTQLNPHFLYNTLDTIKWDAKIHHNPEIPVLAENLAIILRRSISSEPFITLAQELETIRNYIEIQKIRFSGRFLYETEVPDQLETCLVPKMILQPLVENAILHGLEGSENGYICVYAAQSGGLLKISVTDDGCGMNPEMVEWINSNFPQKREGHVGLYNVIQILKLYYGQEYGLHAEVIPGEGTTITITLPLERR